MIGLSIECAVSSEWVFAVSALDLTLQEQETAMAALRSELAGSKEDVAVAREHGQLTARLGGHGHMHHPHEKDAQRTVSGGLNRGVHHRTQCFAFCVRV
jgi:hypothetical protein